MTTREHVQLVDHPFGAEWECQAGQVDPPTGCERHREHHWCATCQGYYGVPHDGMHEGPSAHPDQLYSAAQCACRPCKQATGRA